jgi:hypothetical protein
MIESAETLPSYLQRLVDAGVSGIDIMHGELKLNMLQAEADYDHAIKVEEESEEAMDSMERKYHEGYLDAISKMYKDTYDISFAIADREALNG